MKLLLVRLPMGWLLGSVEAVGAINQAWEGNEDDPPVIATLHYPAEVHPAIAAEQSAIEGAGMVMMGRVYPVWLQIPYINVNLEAAMAFSVLDDTDPSPLVRAYVQSLAAAGGGIAENHAPPGRVRLS